MDILFLDANILFSAAYQKESRLLKLWELSRVKLITSHYAIEEARRNLSGVEQVERLENLLLKMQFVPYVFDSKPLPSNIKLREKDQPIFSAALFAKANYLITGDFKDFGSYFGKTISGVTILTPAAYLAQIS